MSNGSVPSSDSLRDPAIELDLKGHFPRHVQVWMWRRSEQFAVASARLEKARAERQKRAA